MKTNPTKARRAAAPPAPFALGAPWVVALLALLVIVFFHQVALEGQTFVAPDASAPVGFVAVGEHALYHDHVYPLWNPYVFLGMPSFGSGAYNPLIYPPDWPLALLQKVVPVLPDMLWLLLYYFLGGWFFVLLAQEWGARAEGALLGAVALIFAPNLIAVGSHGHGSQLVDSAYLPLVIWLVARWMRRGGIHHLGWIALAGGFQMLRGHAQIAFYTWIAVALVLVVEVALGTPGPDGRKAPLQTRIARAAGVAAAMAVAFGLAGFYNLPLRDYARYSIRGGGPDGGVGMEYATAWSLAPWELPTLVVPGWAGFGAGTYWGGMPFTDYPNAYVGMITVALALLGLRRPGAPQIAATLLGAFALFVAFGHYFPLYGFLYRHLPLFNKFRVPVMIVILFQLAAALGLAWGWSAVLEDASAGKPSARTRIALALGAALSLALLIGTLGRESIRPAYEALAHSHQPQMTGEALDVAARGFLSDLVRVSFLGVMAIALGVLALSRRLSASLASAGVLVLLLVELWPVSASVMNPVIGPRVANRMEQGRDDVVDFLEKAGPPGSFRVLPVAPDEFRSNRLAGFAIASLGGYHAAKPRLYQDLIDARANESGAWLRLLGVRYLISPQPIQSAGLELAFQGSAYVYEYPAAAPRVTVVGEYGVVAEPKAIIDSVSAGTHDPAAFAWLERDLGHPLGPVAGATASLARYGLNDLAIDVETPGPALVRLSDLWYPDWTATVDGRPVPILKTDYALRAVEVLPGRHRIEMRYRSAAVRVGLWLSFGCLLLALAPIVGARWWQGGRGRMGAAPAG